MTRLLSTALCASLLALASPVAADPIRAVVYTGSEALVTHVLSLPGMPEEAQDEQARFEAARGYRSLPGTEGMRDVSFRPVLTFDPNVNGGLPGDRLQVAGLTFLVDPEYVRKSGILIRMEAAAVMRENISPGLALDLRARGMVGYSPQHQVGKLAVDLQGCLRYQANPSRYFHGCTGLNHQRVKLGHQTELHAAIGATQAFGAGRSLHAVTGEIGVRRVFSQGSTPWSQGYVRVSTATALQNGTAIVTSLELGQAVRDVQATGLRASVGLMRDIAGRPTSISVFYSRSQGGMFLGEARRDQTFGVGVTREMSDKLSISASISRTRSNASLFNAGPSLGMNVSYRF